MIVGQSAETRRQLAQTQKWTEFLAGAPVVVVPVMDGDDLTAHSYDEGRLAERILLAAQALDLGADVA